MIGELVYFGTPGPTTLDKGSLTLGRSLDVPRISRYDVDTETPRPEKLLVDYDTTHKLAPHYENAGNIDDEAGVLDSSGQRNHGYFAGAAHYSWAEKAFVFDGDFDYIQGYLNNTGDIDFTVSCWFKRTSDDASECVWFIGEQSTSNPGNGVGLEMTALSDGSGYLFFYSGYEIDDTDLATVVGLNKWVHLVCTRVGNTMKIYLNGEDRNKPITGTAHGLSLAANTVFRVGSRTHTINPAHGMVSNFKIYSVALEPSEIKKLYNLDRTGRSMVISDTAVGIGKVPEAQLDVRGDISCSAMYTGLVASLYNNNISFGIGYTTMTWRVDGAAGFDYGNFNRHQEAEIRLPHKGVYRIYMKMNSQEGSGTNGTVAVHLEFLNEAQNSWTLYQRAERYESAWSGAHELNFSFHCDTTMGFRWRFRLQNVCNQTWDTLDNINNPTWNRTLIFKIA